MEIEEILHQCILLISSGRCEEAIEELDRLITIHPHLFEGWYYRGNALQDSGRFQEALNSYNTAKVINDSIFNLWYSIGIVCVQ